MFFFDKLTRKSRKRKKGSENDFIDRSTRKKKMASECLSLTD